jgi:hypothetical protein
VEGGRVVELVIEGERVVEIEIEVKMKMVMEMEMEMLAKRAEKIVVGREDRGERGEAKWEGLAGLREAGEEREDSGEGERR